MKSIVLILPYFVLEGKSLSDFFQVFLNSCGYNDTIDWIVYTNDKTDFKYPKNVKRISMDFFEFKKRLDAVMKFPHSLEVPYKLCDYKPVYGEACIQDIKDYDFWGYCDCDLIFGNIRHFITDDVLEQYDKICSRGHFTLFRNSEEVNTYWRTQNIIDLSKIYSSSNVCAFDEWGGVSKCWEKDGLPFYDKLVMDDIRVGFCDFRLTKALKGKGSPYHDDSAEYKRYRKMKNIIYKYDNGKLYRMYRINREICREEVLYVHFQKRNITSQMAVAEKYLVIPNKIIPDDAIDFSEIRKLTKLSLRQRIHNNYLTLRSKAYRIKSIFK